MFIGGKIVAAMMMAAGAWAAETNAVGITDEQVSQAIDKGLSWIARGQAADGTFGNGGQARDTPGIWALCGMAFLAKGHVPGSQPYGPVVEKIIAKLVESQRADGYLGGNDGKMYSHCIATLFLSESSGMVGPALQKKIDAALPRALKIILDAQAIDKDKNMAGGWRYQPDSRDSDLSCSGWALMALRSARLNGAPIPPEAIKKAVAYILLRHDEKQGSFGYTDTQSHAVTLTGAGILCLSLCGEHANPAVGRAARYLMDKYQDLPNQQYCFYGLYYAAQGLFQLGGDDWKTFSKWMYDTWTPKQKEDGSWDRGEQDRYYETAMVILAFTVPYRLLPIYQRDETVDEK
jgi:prenyltransferase beta subunit